jgi:hypothetical protein
MVRREARVDNDCYVATELRALNIDARDANLR